jgi:hypothetical protein
MHYQIGTSETRGIVGSRAAKGTTLDQALDECAEYSRARHVKQAWVRPLTPSGQLGDVLAVYERGTLVGAG